MEEKTQINDIDRSIYDIKDEEKERYPSVRRSDRSSTG